MAISVTLATRFLPVTRLRPMLALAILVLVLCNGVTPFAGPTGIVALRAFNGMACGILLWLIIGMFARAENPARLFAIYITAQSVATFVLSTAVANFLAPMFGGAVSYGLVAALGIVLLGAVSSIPPSYPPLQGSGDEGSNDQGNSETSSAMPTLRGVPGLLAIFLYMSGVIALWAYILPIGQQLGLGQNDIAQAISASLAVQIGGGLLAFAVAGRISATLAFLLSALASIAGIVLAVSGSLFGWYVGTAIFAFAWIFCPPFHIPFLLKLDPSRRTALFAGSAQLFGVSFGPFAASLIVAPGQLLSVAWLSLGMLALCGLILAFGSIARLLDLRKRVGNGATS